MSEEPNNNPSSEQPSLIMPPSKPGLFARLRAYFLTGVIVVAPISITIYLALAFIEFVDRNVTPLIPDRYNPANFLKFAFPGLGEVQFTVPGFGLIVVFIVVTLVGFLTANFLGRTFISFGERLVGRMPVIRSIYNALKQILETILAQSNTSFREVVLVEYPRRGLWAVAFITSAAKGEVARGTGENTIAVFLPTTPNPTSGFLLFVKDSDLIRLDMSVEEGVKLVISAGMVWPREHVADMAVKAGQKPGTPDNGDTASTGAGKNPDEKAM